MNRWGQKYNLMERVQRYCRMCHYRKESAVFTQVQWDHICESMGGHMFIWKKKPKANDELFGVPFTIDDTPRPAMRL